MQLLLKKCNNCGAMVQVAKQGDCPVFCCGKEMINVVANSTDAAVEKHKPEYEVVGEHIVVSVNHVMEKEHYIEYLCLVSDKIEIKKHLLPEENAKAVFPYIKGSKIYAYCNKHGLWENDVE